MDKQLVDLIVGVAWPVTVLIIVLAFRPQLLKLFSRISKLRYGDAEAEFGAGVREAKSEQPPLPPTLPTPEQRGRFDRRLEDLTRLAEVAQRAAVIESWVELESVIRRAAARRELERGTPNPSDQMRRLIDEKVLPATYWNQFLDLRKLRNLAAHAEDFAPGIEVAKEYVELAMNLAAAIDTVTGGVG